MSPGSPPPGPQLDSDDRVSTEVSAKSTSSDHVS